VVTVADSRGLTASQPYDVTVRADTQAPGVSLSLSANPAPVGSSVTFLVAATDDVGVAGLTLTLDGRAIALDTNSRATVPMNAARSFAVIPRATDAAGNAGQATASLLVTDPRDTNPPAVDITAPVDDQVLTSSLEVVGTASDPNLVSYTLEVAPV